MRLPYLRRSRSSGARRFRFSREGIVYVTLMTVLFSAAFLSQVNLLILLFGMMAGPFILSGSIVLSMLRGATARRMLPSYAVAGEPFAVEIEAATRHRWLGVRTLVVRDYLSRPSSGLVGLAFFDRVLPGPARAVHYHATLPQRGRYGFAHLRLSSRFPLGLIERAKILDCPADLIVYPRLGRLTRRWKQLKRAMLESAASYRPRKALMQDEYHGLRAFRPGDSARWIHWRTSARKGELMVKEFEHPLRQDLGVLLDAWLPAQPQPADHERLEQAISFAATLCVDLRRSGASRLLLGLAAEEPRVWQGACSQRLLHELLEQLAVLSGSSEASLPSLLERLAPMDLAGLAFVIVTPRTPDLRDELGNHRASPIAQSVWRAIARHAHLISVARGDVAAYTRWE